MAPLFHRSEHSPLHDATDEQIYELVRHTTKTAWLRCIASSLYPRMKGAEIRCKIVEQNHGHIAKVRLGAKGWGETYQYISVSEATTIMHKAREM